MERSKGKKQPLYITASSSKRFAFAGLWEAWDKEDARYKSCTILKTAASESVRDIHTRMPVILAPSFCKNWLDPENQDQEHLKAILEKGVITELSSHPVSMKVNNVRDNDPSNIEPISSNSD